MSHLMTALAMRQTGIKPAAKIVLYWLADHHNGETERCFPSLKTLERECEMNRSAIVRHLKSLEADGLISRDKRTRDNGSQTSTSYKLHLVPVAKRNTPCCKTQQPPVAKRDPHNLGNNNLGKEPINNMLNEPSFDDFWSVVPRKAGKGGARKAWDRAIKKTSPQSIIDAMRSYAEHVKSNRTEDCWIKHPSGWLNDERWSDVLPQASGQRGNNFLDKFQEQLKGDQDDNGLFQAHSNDTKRIG